MKRRDLAVLLAAMLGCAGAAADEGKRLQAKAMSCFSCHGANGVSISGVWPNLAGQKQDYLEKQLRDFRSGKRTDPMMEPLAKNLSDEDIRDLARYFSGIKGVAER